MRRRDFLPWIGLLPGAAASCAQPGPARLLVRLRDEHGAPVAARIYLRDATGSPHTPEGSIAREIVRTGEPYFHASTQFEVTLPPGTATIESVKGFEYTPVRRMV